jgi:hypothetical protein
MKWIETINHLPNIKGKYLVKTKTSMGNVQRLDAYLTITDGKAKFNVTNQIVTHWLKE